MSNAQRQSDDLQLRAWRRGEMDASSEDAFETRLFFEPELLAAAQTDQSFADGMRLLDEANPTLFAEAAASRTTAVAMKASMRRPIVAGPWSMLLAAGLGALAVLPFATQFQSVPQATGNLEWVSVDVRRGATSEPLVVAPRASAGIVAMELPAPVVGSPPFTLKLVAVDGGAASLVVGGLQPSDGLLSFAFPRDQLRAGDYRIEVAGADGLTAGGEVVVIRYLPE